MSQLVYSGNVSAAQGLNYTRNVPLSNTSGGVAEGIINFIRAYVQMSTNAYGNTYAIWVTVNFTGGTSQSYRSDIKFTSSNYGGATFEFGFSSHIDPNSISSIDVLAESNGSQVFVKGTQQVVVDYSVPTSATPPTTASVTPALAESVPTLNASGAAGGDFNAITGYEIQYAESADGVSWGVWTGLKTVNTSSGSLSTPASRPSARGRYRKHRLRTLGSAGASYYSAWKETNAVRYNQIPTAPTTFSATPEVYVSGTITLSYSGATDPDGNLSTHNVQYAVLSAGIWGAWTSLANGAKTHTLTLSAGQSIKYRARAVDSLGAVSAYKESNVCGKNTAPAAPIINHPFVGKTTHNSRPRVMITMGADPENHLQSVIAEGYTPSRVSGILSGSKVLLRKTQPTTPGSVSVSVSGKDAHNESSPIVSRTTSYALLTLTDVPVVAGGTRIKAAHINELRAAVETIRKYYGFGDNLVPNTDTSVDQTSHWTTWGNTSIGRWGEYLRYYTDANNPTGIITPEFLLQASAGEKLTLSFSAAQNSFPEVALNYNYIMDSVFGNVPLSTIGGTEHTLTGSTTGPRYVITVTLPRNFNHRIRLLIGTKNAAAGDIGVVIGYPKLEVGRIATPWVSGKGSEATVWGEDIISGVTKTRRWRAHILEIRQSIEDIITRVNGWDSESNINAIAVPKWSELSERPNAEVINQLREVLTWL